MKKLIYLITGFSLITLVILLWPTKSYSQTELPHSEATTCRQAWTNGIAALEDGWAQNLRQIVDQEKATSDSVDEAFESMRTYRCWLDYLCLSVKWSGGQNAAEYTERGLSQAGALSRYSLGKVPGCVNPEKVVLPSTWSDFQNSISGNTLYLPPAQGDKFTFIPQCVGGSTGQTQAEYAASVSQFEDCKQQVALRFAESDEIETAEEFADRSTAYIKVEAALSDSASEKKARAVEDKLFDIADKLQNTQLRAQQFKQNFQDLLKRIPCLLPQCT